MAITDKLTAIADAIRAKTGKTTLLSMEDMAIEQDAVFEAGKKAEYDRFWDSYQNNGNRTSYSYAFAGEGWNDALYAPKYPIIGSSLNALNNLYAYSSATDTKVDIVFNNNCRLTSTFSSATKMVIIRKLVVNENTTYTASAFAAATKIEELNFEGVIGQSGLDVSPCTNLPHDSLMSIINALQTKTSGTWTVTLGSTNLAKLTDAEKAIATQKGWTLA